MQAYFLEFLVFHLAIVSDFLQSVYIDNSWTHSFKFYLPCLTNTWLTSNSISQPSTIILSTAKFLRKFSVSETWRQLNILLMQFKYVLKMIHWLHQKDNETNHNVYRLLPRHAFGVIGLQAAVLHFVDFSFQHDHAECEPTVHVV